MAGRRVTGLLLAVCLIQLLSFGQTGSGGFFSSVEVAQEHPFAVVGDAGRPFFTVLSEGDTAIARSAVSERSPFTGLDFGSLVGEVQTSELSESGAGSGVISPGSFLRTVVQPEVRASDSSRPLAFKAVDPLMPAGIVASSSAVPDVLGIGGTTEIRPAIVEAIAVDMVNIDARSSAEHETVHTYRDVLTSRVIAALGIDPTTAISRDAPAVLADALNVFGTNEREVALSQRDADAVFFFHVPILA